MSLRSGSRIPRDSYSRKHRIITLIFFYYEPSATSKQFIKRPSVLINIPIRNIFSVFNDIEPNSHILHSLIFAYYI